MPVALLNTVVSDIVAGRSALAIDASGMSRTPPVCIIKFDVVSVSRTVAVSTYTTAVALLNEPPTDVAVDVPGPTHTPADVNIMFVVPVVGSQNTMLP